VRLVTRGWYHCPLQEAKERNFGRGLVLALVSCPTSHPVRAREVELLYVQDGELRTGFLRGARKYQRLGFHLASRLGRC